MESPKNSEMAGKFSRSGEHADAVAEFEARVAGGDEVHVAAAQARYRGAHAVLQVEFADALADDLLAGDENAAEIELGAVQLDVGLEGLAEDLFGAHQAVVIADGHHDVAPLKPGVAAGDLARRPHAGCG